MNRELFTHVLHMIHTHDDIEDMVGYVRNSLHNYNTFDQNSMTNYALYTQVTVIVLCRILHLKSDNFNTLTFPNTPMAFDPSIRPLASAMGLSSLRPVRVMVTLWLNGRFSVPIIIRAIGP